MTHKRVELKKTIILLSLFVFAPLSIAAAPDKQLSTKTLRSMARAYMAFGKYDKAHALTERALKQSQSENTEIGEKALCLIDMGTVCGYQENFSQARQYLQQGVELQKEALFGDHPYVAHTLRMLSAVYRKEENLEQSEEILAKSIRIMLKHCDVESKEMAPFILESAKLQFEKGQLDRAQNNFQTALDIYEENYGPQHLMTANVLEDLARLNIAEKQIDNASQLMSRSLAIKTKVFGRYHPMLIDSWLQMARICKYQGQLERCEYYLAKSTETCSQSNNVVEMAKVYDQVNQIRKEGLVAAAISFKSIDR